MLNFIHHAYSIPNSRMISVHITAHTKTRGSIVFLQTILAHISRLFSFAWSFFCMFAIIQISHALAKDTHATEKLWFFCKRISAGVVTDVYVTIAWKLRRRGCGLFAIVTDITTSSATSPWVMVRYLKIHNSYACAKRIRVCQMIYLRCIMYRIRN